MPPALACAQGPKKPPQGLRHHRRAHRDPGCAAVQVRLGRHPPRPANEDADRYEALVTAALDYRIEVLERTLAVLGRLGSSRLRDVHRVLEDDAQKVWGRRLALQASDLVRFSRTYRTWRNFQVEMLGIDRKCFDQLTCLADAAFAHDRASDAGGARTRPRHRNRH